MTLLMSTASDAKSSDRLQTLYEPDFRLVDYSENALHDFNSDCNLERKETRKRKIRKMGCIEGLKKLSFPNGFKRHPH